MPSPLRRFPIAVLAALLPFASPADDAPHAAATPASAARPGVVPPKLLRWPACPYPRASRLFRESGVVRLAFDVQTNGRVANVVVVESSGAPRLDEAARDCVAGGLLRPAIEGGRAIVTREEIAWRWNLVEEPVSLHSHDYLAALWGQCLASHAALESQVACLRSSMQTTPSRRAGIRNPESAEVLAAAEALVAEVRSGRGTEAEARAAVQASIARLIGG